MKSLTINLKNAVLFCVFLLFVVNIGCGKTQFIVNGSTMGTTYSVKSNIYIDKNLIEEALSRLNKIFSSWDEHSELSKLNQNTSKTWIKTSTDLFFLLTKAQQIYQQTNGYFDIGIGNIINTWGFNVNKIVNEPTTQQVSHALQTSSMKYLLLKDNMLQKTRDIQLNLSAIAKGYAVDKIAMLLTQKGSTDFVVEIGGEVRVLGQKNIGIEHITQPIKITLNNQAIATSGNYRNYQILSGKKFIHVLNPHTGRPSKNNLVSVSVIHNQTYAADAYATALLAMGKPKAIKFIQKYQLKSVLIDKNNKVYKFNL